jgi:DNA-directed RNA polymerase specialized sigma24 family protein
MATNRERLMSAARRLLASRADAEDAVQDTYIRALASFTDWLGAQPAFWASLVFTPAKYPYRDGVWPGSLIVVVDGDTWSATEEFAAVLQDNHAALIVRAPL